MSSLLQQLHKDLIQATKQRETQRLSTLRLLNAALKNKQIEQRHPLEENEILAVVRTQIKQLQDSLEMAEKANRTDLVTRAQEEINVLQEYHPKPLTSQELDQLVHEVFDELEVKGKEEMGKIMGVVMTRVAGRSDGRQIKQAVERMFSTL
ncbi:aspartyl-tRNA amidotransferase [Candidatus Uhrbacteria bacterium CG_4_9_14_3_um_filter_36_7]|uniref:Aspartyl-tRNA amidotransferase n=1 Tax=Candidatus Uhrbacteria bacterium CG_4_9_14_3_um_filter_36_7 TaxID=1975033 RepID=A0A2M7XI36_9BACT|nr:MAG: aspartyl-tRNA amidotransferase [Candidatus Uhrbacteria bacterium CG_4_9_14_3_um_filter_36_7]